MAETFTVQLGSAVERLIDHRGRTPKKLGGDFTQAGVPVISANNVHAGRVTDDDARFVSYEMFRRWMPHPLRPGDVILTSEAPLGETAYWRSTGPVCLGQRLFALRADPKVADPLFLYYVLRSPGVQHQLHARATGTTAQGIRQAELVKVKVDLPALPAQKAIGEVLGALDDKIDVNRRISQTLERIAQTLFKSWFIDFDSVRAKKDGRDPNLAAEIADVFPSQLKTSKLPVIPDGWREGPLGDFFDIGRGGVWGEEEASGTAVISTQVLRGIDCHQLAEGSNPDAPVRWLSEKQLSARALSEGCILVEGSGSFCGRSLYWQPSYETVLGERVSYSNFCKRLDPKVTPAQSLVCWYWMRHSYRRGDLQAFRTGSAFPNFDVHGLLANFHVVVPPEGVCRAFATIADDARGIQRMRESEILAELRDTLLPRLISGEVRVRVTGDGTVDELEAATAASIASTASSS
jgi:type I restriction enzyme S subunit